MNKHPSENSNEEKKQLLTQVEEQKKLLEQLTSSLEKLMDLFGKQSERMEDLYASVVSLETIVKSMQERLNRLEGQPVNRSSHSPRLLSSSKNR